MIPLRRPTDVVQFTPEAAQRIGRAVLTVENQVPAGKPLVFEALPPTAASKALRVGKIDCDWAVGQCVTVTLWGGIGTCTPTQTSPPQTIENVRNVSRAVAMGSWVVIGKAADGKWYLVEAGSPDDDACRKTIGGEDITKWTGWDGSKVQLLGHDENGCLKWFDVNSCDTPSGP